MAWVKVPAEELRRRRRALERKRKRSEAKQGPDDAANRGDDVCAICDNGGSLTCCDGGCKRSFHLDDSEGSTCRSALGLTEDETKRVIDAEEVFVCKNCRYRQHQCFACGLLGSSSSDPSSSSSSSPEVFQCAHDDDDCGRFYHPKCVAKLLYSDDGGEEAAAACFERQVAAGLGFVCPVHQCCVCREGENEGDEDMQFAVCRRCPTAYHRKCLPREILFEATKGSDGSVQRAWEGILPNRILIFCMKHDIVRKLRTPTRDHIVFPDAGKLGAAEVPEDSSPMEQDSVVSKSKSKGAEQHKLSSSEPSGSGSPLLAASKKKPCFWSGHSHSHGDSFAPKALFMHPQPGSCGWIDDDE